MNIRREYLITNLLMITVILLAGCGGCDRKSDPPQTPVQRPTPLIPSERLSDKEPPDLVPEPVEEPIVEEPEPLPTPLPVPDVLPEVPPAMTYENKNIWSAFITEAFNDEQLFEKIIPASPKEAFKFMEYVHRYVESDYRMDFTTAFWREMADRLPNDPEMLFMHSTYSGLGRTDATREQKLEYIALWERLKKLNDANNIPPMSGLRKTHNLSQFYIDVGEYDKAIENIKEQNARIEKLEAAGVRDEFMYMGLLGDAGIWLVEELKRRQQEKKQEHQNDPIRKFHMKRYIFPLLILIGNILCFFFGFDFYILTNTISN